ncbi:NrdH-redoxin [Patescibacteria group bacterium]|nr:NrdH-redoxin [Patescibacteria group bacterium]
MIQPKKYIVYSTPTCGYCRLLKDWLTSKQVKFESVDVALDPKRGQEMIQKTGQMGVPVSIITLPDNHEEIILGFDQARIASLLGL